jgi:FixJ family two-component response regulator
VTRPLGGLVEMGRMILAHRSLSKTHQQLLNKYKALSEAEREVLRLVIKSLEVQMEEVARMIAEGLGKDIRPTIG